jgi:ATP-dependent 26S proteasome regulatory subunit
MAKNDTPASTPELTPLQREIRNSVNGGFGGIWLSSNCEHMDATLEITKLAVQRGWHLLFWDANSGTMIPSDIQADGTAKQMHRVAPTVPAGESDLDPGAPPQPAAPDFTPDLAYAALAGAPIDEDNGGRAVLVMRNLHLLLTDAQGHPQITHLQALQSAIEYGTAHRRHIIILAYPWVTVPQEIAKMVYAIDQPLPTREELRELMHYSGARPEMLPIRDSAAEKVLLDAAIGLNRTEAAGAFGLSVATVNKLDAVVVRSLKENAIRKSGLLEIIKPDIDFSSLGGLEPFKTFTKRLFSNPNRSARLRPKGLLLTGLPGSGKSASCKALSKELGWPAVSLDWGSLMGSLVGQTEGRLRTALATCVAMAPVIVVVEELEKGLAGAGSGELDSGVGSRLLSTLLTFLQDNTADVFFVANCNDASKLGQVSSGALTRAGRWNAMFFFDLPGRTQKDQIWTIHEKKYELPEAWCGPSNRPDDKHWTGAEIEHCCYTAMSLNIPPKEAALWVVPIAVTSHEQIKAARSWASRRCLSADYVGLYDQNKQLAEDKPAKAAPSRQVRRAVDTTAADAA